MIKKNIYNKEYAFSEFIGRPWYNETTQKAIYYGDWKLIEVTPESEIMPSSLFNLKTDPKEQNNLYDINIKEREFLQEYIMNITKS